MTPSPSLASLSQQCSPSSSLSSHPGHPSCLSISPGEPPIAIIAPPENCRREISSAALSAPHHPSQISHLSVFPGLRSQTASVKPGALPLLLRPTPRTQVHWPLTGTGWKG